MVPRKIKKQYVYIKGAEDHQASYLPDGSQYVVEHRATHDEKGLRGIQIVLGRFSGCVILIPKKKIKRLAPVLDL